ncbi:hypothetical protein ES708_24063 [subsurface metagenome]
MTKNKPAVEDLLELCCTVAVHSDETIKTMVSNCLQDLGGIEKLVPPGSRILLKPNMVVAKPNSTGLRIFITIITYHFLLITF